MEKENKPKILIIDDEKGLRLGTKRLLELEGYFVDTAENGTEGIALGTKSEYDLALIDLKMPDKDGIEVLTEISKVYPNTVCFITTAYASYETAIESTKIGAFSYIPKPFLPEELILQLKKGYDKRLLLIETEKWKREREMRLLEVAFEKTRLNTIINSISDGLLVINKRGEAVLYNPSVLKYLQLQTIQLEVYVVDKLHPEIAQLVSKYLDAEKFINASYSVQIELQFTEKIFIEVTSSPVPHPDGTLAGVVLVIKNITELKKIELLKSQFVSMVSHELKAPIAAVYGYLKLLNDNSIQVSEEQKSNFIDRSQNRLDSLLKLVNDLLDISRMETKTIRREIKEIDLQSVVKSIVELFQLEIKNKEIEVIAHYKSCSSINADIDEITRLFTNLISNAIKYNRKNGRINIELSQSGNYNLIEIKDTGIGMKPAEIKKLFHEFFRAKNELTQNICGTGLGLSIVKRIVDSYAGKIEVESEYNVGSVFKVYLPYK
ncbi:MAG: ATP-binding protein [Ignavibacteria bacterium]|nr:ATP-binding protein [Ignavibacteria bacterium]